MNQTAIPAPAPAVKAVPPVAPTVILKTTKLDLQAVLDAAVLDSMKLARRAIRDDKYGQAHMHLDEATKAARMLHSMIPTPADAPPVK